MTPQILAAITLVCTLFGMAAGWAGRGVIAERDIAELKTLHAQAQRVAVEQALTDSEAARQVEIKRTERIQEIAREANERLLAARAAARAADLVSQRLRDHIVELVNPAWDGGAGVDPPADRSGPPTAGPGLLLSKLFGEADRTAGELAAWADEAHLAGLACQRAYDSLTP